ncbi:SWIM zinc finger family protein [Streptomyces sp. NRRL S-37]|uniref:SWIM zinc finger family protein n=1 Tax=Streptomyces sp. NRRL S-37 TaxID=1463903 RepID=UPI0004CB12A8|nr:SWIM zinc finger family protein [Streptomyces sp. NRRL S-37]
MTPRPSDEAREALRAARARTAREPAATAAPEHRPAPDQPAVPPPGRPGRGTRPGDVAREALRQAVRARRGTAGPADATAPHREDTGTPEAEDKAPSEEGPHGDGPRPAGPPSADPSSGDTEAAADSGTGHRAPPRPGDIAREALRSAREEALRARPAPGDRATDDEPRARRAPAPRVPRTTRGDRAADARAREVRESLTDAFRMPGPVTEPDPDTGTAPGPSDTPAPSGGSRSHGGPPAAGSRDGASVSAGPPGTPRGTAPPAPVTPRSMAAPARDGDLRRTFPAFPPRASDSEGFAETWWGDAWVTALEEGALDAARLARGRGYAEQGRVDAITVTPGLVLAYVQGSRPRPYRVQVRLRTFTDADWERFLDAAADRPGHIAALLDKEMPQSLADCGAALLPGPGDLAPQCGCPDSGHPCKHAAALCYQTARLLDADPFVLLLLRGRGERQVIDALSRLSATRAARAARERAPEPLPGVRAADVLARRDRELPPLPAPLPPPPHPGQPPVYPASPGGPDPFALDQLATDAAARAHALLTTGRDPVGRLTLWQDAVRLAAARPGSGLTAATRTLYSSLARAAGRTPAELARAVAAWRQGGPTGLAVLEEPWDPPAGRFDRARPLLLAADLPAFRPWRNHLTHPRGHVQLRLGRDHLWYAYESEPGHDDWWPRGTPDPDPVGALTGLDAPAGL